MKNFMVIVNVNGIDYLTNLAAQSALEAEHAFLDEAICGRHEYGVSAAMAYDTKMMKTDTFIGASIHSITVTPTRLLDIIEQNNERIKARDAAEDLIAKNRKLIAELQAQMDAAQDILNKR